MSVYEMQRYMYASLRALEHEGGQLPAFDSYQLTQDERANLQPANVAFLHEAGAHPVLIQLYGRATGLTTEDLRRELRTITRPGTEESRGGRWQK